MPGPNKTYNNVIDKNKKIYWKTNNVQNLQEITVTPTTTRTPRKEEFKGELTGKTSNNLNLPLMKDEREDDYEKKYVMDWLNQRKETGLYESQINSHELNQQIENIKTAKSLKFNPAEREIEKFNYYTGKEKPSFIDFAANGQYYPKKHTYSVSNTVSDKIKSHYPERSVRIHEVTHAINAVPQYEAIAKIFKKDGIQYKETFFKPANYNNNPEEVYSRLMQFRNENNLDPKKIYTEEDVNNMRNNTFMNNQNSNIQTNNDSIKSPYINGKYNINDFNLLKRYENKTILKLLNEVADNKTKKQNSIYTNNIT